MKLGLPLFHLFSAVSKPCIAESGHDRWCREVQLKAQHNLEVKKVLKKTIVILLTCSMIFTGLTSSVSAAVIGTQQAMAMEARQAQISKIQASLARDDVQKIMIELGVDPAEAAMRVSSLSDQELAALDHRIDNLPAGSGVLVLIGAVFVVLIILELTGIIDIFKKA